MKDPQIVELDPIQELKQPVLKQWFPIKIRAIGLSKLSKKK